MFERIRRRLLLRKHRRLLREMDFQKPKEWPLGVVQPSQGTLAVGSRPWAHEIHLGLTCPDFGPGWAGKFKVLKKMGPDPTGLNREWWVRSRKDLN